MLLLSPLVMVDWLSIKLETVRTHNLCIVLLHKQQLIFLSNIIEIKMRGILGDTWS
jgi:hypothetical protein